MAVDWAEFEPVDAAPVSPDAKTDWNDFEPVPEPSKTGVVGGFTRGANIGVGGVLKGMGALGLPEPRVPDIAPKRAWWDLATKAADEQERYERQKREGPALKLKALQDDPLFQAGKYIQETGSAIPAPAGLPGKASEMVGGMLPVVLTGPAAPATIGIQAYGDTIDSQFTEAKKAGLSDEDAAAKALSTAAKSGLTQAAIWAALPRPLQSVLGKATGLVGGGAIAQFLTRRAAGAVEGAAMGTATQAGQNIVTGQPIGQGMLPAATGMAALTSIMPRGGVPPKEPSILPEAEAALREVPPLPEQPTTTSQEDAIAALNANLAEAKAGRVAAGLEEPTPQPATQIGSVVIKDSDGRGTTTKRDGKWYRRPNPLSTEVEITDPDIIRGLESKLPTPEVSDASSLETPATVHANVPAQPVEGTREVPTQESGQGIQPPEVQQQGQVPLKTYTNEAEATPDLVPLKPGDEAPVAFDKLDPMASFMGWYKPTRPMLASDGKMYWPDPDGRIRLSANQITGAGFKIPESELAKFKAAGGTERAATPKPPESPVTAPVVDSKGRTPERQALLDKMAESVKESTATEGVLPKPKEPAPSTITEAIGGAGRGVVDSLYEGMFERLKAGKSPEPFPADKQSEFSELLQVAWDAKQIKSPEDIRALANEGGIEKTKLQEPGKKYRVGANPTTHTIFERLPQLETEKANGEQPVKIRNDKTGSESTVMESDLTPVKERTAEQRTAVKPSAPLDERLRAAGLDPSSFPNAVSKRAALKRQVAIGAGPGAATSPGATIATDIGGMEVNIPPLETLADAVSRFPRQKGGGFKEKLKEWIDEVGIPAKNVAARALVAAKAQIARVIDAQQKLPEVTSMDRSVGRWDAADTEGSLAAQRFVKTVRQVFPNRAKLRALSNWINAEGDKDLLARQAALTKDPELKKTYEDALKFGKPEADLAREIQHYHDVMLAWAQREGALEEGLENYLHRYYKPDDPVLEKKLAAVRYLRFTRDFPGFKKRYYDSDFEAEQSGLKPEKDAARRILAYDNGFRRALTARAFVRERYEAMMPAEKLPDGTSIRRPELDVVGGGTKVGEGDGKGATLIKPKWRQDSGDPKDYRGDYVTFDHPAFRKWKFATTDSAGTPILVEGDVLVHPDAAKKYAALFDKSWWSKGPVRKGLLQASAVVKQTMLDLSGFHPVQIGIHAVEHQVNPFKLEDLNTMDPKQRELVEGGLAVADTGAAQGFSEGVFGTGLTQKIPILGERSKLIQDWLFKDYIPRIKMTMALHALERNIDRYSKDLAAGKITREQLVRLTARESNAAFGEQNYRAMAAATGRSKSFQDTLRFLFLAPDFGEARLRFPLQAMHKYGGEQRMALVLGAIGMAVIAKIIEKIVSGENHFDRPFTVTHNGREYGARNVASDLWHLITDPQSYIRNRLNPLYLRPALEAITGRDAFGRKRTKMQQLTDEAKQVIPISLRGGVEKDQTIWESFLNAFGVTERRKTAFGDEMKKVNAWKASKGYEEPGEFIYDADKDPYHTLTTQLTLGNDGKALKELNRMLEGKTPAQRGKIREHYERTLFGVKHLTGNATHEQEYVKSLSPSGNQEYQEALAERKAMAARWQRIWKQRKPIAPQ